VLVRIAAGVLFVLLVAVAAQGASGSGSEVRQAGIYQVRIDGSGRTLLSAVPRIGHIEDLSPDRQDVLFEYDGGGAELYAGAVKGGDVRLVSRLSGPRYIDHAIWSPDGKRIALEVVDESGCDPIFSGCAVGEIWLAKPPPGRTLRRLVVNGIAPTWSPNARRIAYVGSFDAFLQQGTVSVVNTKGPVREQRVRPVEYGHWDDWSTAWSPDGDRLAYSTGLYFRNQPTFRVVRTKGREWTGPQTAGTFAEWSPAADRILFWDAKSSRIIASRPDGRQRRFLTTAYTTGLSGPVSWSPDRRWIAFVRKTGRYCYQVFLIRPSGRDRRQLTHEPCTAYFDLFWLPDSKRLIYSLAIDTP
jgi:Tol biopolymer transport system component